MENVVLLVTLVTVIFGGFALYQRTRRRNLEQPFTEDPAEGDEDQDEDQGSSFAVRPSGTPQALTLALSVQRARPSKPLYSSARPLAQPVEDPLPYSLPDAVDLVPLSAFSNDPEPVRQHPVATHHHYEPAPHTPAVHHHEPSYHHDTPSHSHDSSSYSSHDSGGGGYDGGSGGSSGD